MLCHHGSSIKMDVNEVLFLGARELNCLKYSVKMCLSGGADSSEFCALGGVPVSLLQVAVLHVSAQLIFLSCLVFTCKLPPS
jgi:hypothetical protein